jgi:hypothetical protein
VKITSSTTPARKLAHVAQAGLRPLVSLNNTLSAVPKFIYPTVTGTADQQAMIWETLDKLPMHHAVRPNSIGVVPSIDGTPNILGRNLSPLGRVTLSESGHGMSNPDVFKNTVNHEVGHSVDHPSGFFSIFTKSRPSDSEPFGAGPNVSDYAGTNPREDFAESYELHRHDPQALRDVNAAKADELQQLDKPTYLQRLVDRPAFRETGKWIGKQFQAYPQLRTGLEIVRQTGIFSLALAGSAKVTEGVIDKDSRDVALGLLQTGAGVGLALAPSVPWLGVAATAALGGSVGVKAAQDAQADAGRTVASMIGAGVGGVLGGFVTPLVATQLGYTLAGPAGGALALLAGGMLGGTLGAKLGAKFALGKSPEGARPQE